ncbi:MAG: hypothetical protein IIW94_00420 [Clostridia bacterium]|nr:hypothetical protein [Clostridia bacterium]
MKKVIALLLLIVFILPTVLIPADAATTMNLAEIFRDNMVLQRGKPICVYGSGSGKGTVTLGNTTKKVTTTSEGWQVVFDPMQASTTPINFSYDLSGNKGTISNVLVGDVYVAAGQSNMALTLGDTDHAETASKDSSILRCNHYGYWQTFKKSSVKDFTAIGVMFAQELEEKLNKKIPIGIISVALGASRIDDWTSEKYCQCDRFYTVPHSDFDKNDKGHHDLYKKHIEPITKFAVAGVLWYQGESNAGAGEAMYYYEAFRNMVKCWREAFADNSLPFYTVQIMLYADDGAKDANGNERDEFNIRIAQGEAARSIENVTVCTLLSYEDTVLENGHLNVHPTNKMPVAKALANAALTTYYKPLGDYGDTPEYSGPLYKEVKVNGNTAEITFNHADGLAISDGSGIVRELEARTTGGRWVDVDGILDGDKVTVTLENVSQITGVRMGYRNRPTINLYNSAGYCASPFMWQDENAKIEHAPMTTWAYDDEVHWHNCDVEGCEEKFSAAAHSGGKAENCTVKPKCEVCNKAYGDYGPHKKTEIKNKTASYTGDKVCIVCRDVVKKGRPMSEIYITVAAVIIGVAVIAAAFVITIKKRKTKLKAEENKQ